MTGSERPGLPVHRIMGLLGRHGRDSPTGLHRAERLTRLGPRLLGGAGPDQECAFLLLNLDHVPPRTDDSGHEMGERILAEAGRRIAQTALPNDLAVRLGEHEFVLLTAPTSDSTWVASLAQRLIETISAPIHLDNLDRFVQVSIGISFSSRDGATLPQLRAAADRAMYAAKGSGPGRWRISSGSADASDRSNQLLDALREDPDATCVGVHYQPQIDAASGQVVGFEALARWEHPELGPAPPDEIIPLAERSALMPAFNRAVLRRALSDLPRLQEAAPHARLALNITTRHLMGRGLAQGLQRELLAHETDPRYLTVETNETVVRGSSAQWVALSSLRDLGVAVSVRTFGTHESALSALWSSPEVTEVKMGPEFLVAAADDPELSRRTLAVVTAAKTQGLRIVAQGIEERDSAVAATDLGCDVLQGFWIARVADLDATVAWTQTWSEQGYQLATQQGATG